MKIVAIIECDSCCTYEEIVLKEGENNVSSCQCGNYYGDEGGRVSVKSDKHG